MNESITISKLNNQIKLLNYELSKSKKKSIELEKSLIKLQKDYTDLKVRLNISNSKEIEYQNMKENLKEKNNIITNLDKEIGEIKRDFEHKKKEYDDRYNHDIDQVRFMNEKLNIKNDTKKRMLDLINQGKKLKNKESKDKFELMEKFSILNHNSLLNELEFESLQLEDLLKQREHLDKVINRMKSDIDIHKNVEKMLINKNKKYIDMIKILSEKIEKDKKEKGKEKNNDEPVNENENEKQLFFGKFQRSIDNNRYNANNNILKKSQSILKLGTITNKRMNMTSYRSKFFIRNNSQNSQNFPDFKNKNEKIIKEKVELQRELIQKTKEIDLLRRNCSHYKDQLNYINNRYSNILSLYDTALEKIYKENLEDLKEIYIDFNEFNKCDFDKLTDEKKYSIILLLIQSILPLINENTLPENIKKNMRSTQARFYLNETNDSSIRVKNINSSFFELNMRENENKLRRFRDGTWDISKNKINNKRKKNKQIEKQRIKENN